MPKCKLPVLTYLTQNVAFSSHFYLTPHFYNTVFLLSPSLYQPSDLGNPEAALQSKSISGHLSAWLTSASHPKSTQNRYKNRTAFNMHSEDRLTQHYLFPSSYLPLRKGTCFKSVRNASCSINLCRELSKSSVEWQATKQTKDSPSPHLPPPAQLLQVL